MKHVTLYTRATCHYCHMTKDYLQQKGVSYKEFDITSDEAKQQEAFALAGELSVPVINVQNGQSTVIVGFNQSALNKALNLA